LSEGAVQRDCQPAQNKEDAARFTHGVFPVRRGANSTTTSGTVAVSGLKC
jgi:hypothetical protein